MDVHVRVDVRPQAGDENSTRWLAVARTSAHSLNPACNVVHPLHVGNVIGVGTAYSDVCCRGADQHAGLKSGKFDILAENIDCIELGFSGEVAVDV